MTLAQAYRALINPFSRRTKSTAIVYSGAKRTVYNCVCGSTHTAATSYRRAKHVFAWESEHKSCMRKALRPYLGPDASLLED